ncbi:hypothetical protein C3H43_01880 [Campylobacter jejuni]|nr:hypothetical protein C3H52_02545 [Campylobacter jejuni]RTJ96169.1 hypothetical protein C3H43_01880 [Campylobacter jejuni]
MKKMTRTIHNLFFIIANKITLCKFYNNELSILQKEGENSFEIKHDFWNWWEDKEEYMQGDKLDFAFVWDKENEIIFQSSFFVGFLENSIWDKNMLEKALNMLDFNFRIKTQDGVIIGNKKSSIDLHSNIKLQNKINKNTLILNKKQKESEADKFLRLEREREYQERMRD